MREQLIDDLLEENRELDRFVSSLDSASWARETPFFDWTVRDQILHLFQVDRFGLISLEADAPFSETVAAVRAHQAEGIELSQAIREEFAARSNEEVLETWRQGYRAIAAALRDAAEGTRLDWFGPPMGVASFATARLMEVWAHGQDIYDLFEVRREPTARIRHICELGVRTFGWSFRNRELDVPQRPSVTLTGPGGETWTWDGDGEGTVSGSAHDFALVVTQRRAPSDTGLEAEGEIAREWLSIAQCFAGAPQEPAAPESRPLA